MWLRRVAWGALHQWQTAVVTAANNEVTWPADVQGFPYSLIALVSRRDRERKSREVRMISTPEMLLLSEGGTEVSSLPINGPSPCLTAALPVSVKSC